MFLLICWEFIVFIEEVVLDIVEGEFIEVGEIWFDDCHVFADELGVKIVL